MQSKCFNCKYYEQEYYLENGKMLRLSPGYCKRKHRRKIREQTCGSFSLRDTEQEEELIIRRQELYSEIEELTVFLGKLKALAGIAIQIQELFKKKED